MTVEKGIARVDKTQARDIEADLDGSINLRPLLSPRRRTRVRAGIAG